jgi:hypothetical protein
MQVTVVTESVRLLNMTVHYAVYLAQNQNHKTITPLLFPSFSQTVQTGGVSNPILLVEFFQASFNHGGLSHPHTDRAVHIAARR